MKYQVTKKQCQQKIDELNHVCDRCGRKIKPLKTVNNSGEPTYWAACMHGQTKDGSWGHFTNGTTKNTYDLAVKLVLEDSSGFGMSYEDRENNLQYAWENAISRACSLISHIEWMKNGTPRYTKKQLFKQYTKQH
jgi:hypothetical protein